MLAVRRETIEDIPWVRILNERAFGQAVEADIVDRRRQACPETLSVVREDEGCVVGHSG